jgi:hypothetical protein
MKRIIPLIALFGLSGCASMMSPSAEKMAALPVVEIGQPAPADNEYVLHIVAGKPAPFKLTVTGDAVMQPAEATVMVTARNDVYLYKYWASLDGKTWKRIHDLFRNQIAIGMDNNGGKTEIRFDHAKP